VKLLRFLEQTSPREKLKLVSNPLVYTGRRKIGFPIFHAESHDIGLGNRLSVLAELFFRSGSAKGKLLINEKNAGAGQRLKQELLTLSGCEALEISGADLST